jgi:hypothetical protein
MELLLFKMELVLKAVDLLMISRLLQQIVLPLRYGPILIGLLEYNVMRVNIAAVVPPHLLLAALMGLVFVLLL